MGKLGRKKGGGSSEKRRRETNVKRGDEGEIRREGAARCGREESDQHLAEGRRVVVVKVGWALFKVGWALCNVGRPDHKDHKDRKDHKEEDGPGDKNEKKKGI